MRVNLHEFADHLNLAIDYGGRREIADAVRALAREVERGVRTAASIDDETIATRLYTAGLPDPDLVIRTGGERRISNFLLYQSAYAEFLGPRRCGPISAKPTWWPRSRITNGAGAATGPKKT